MVVDGFKRELGRNGGISVMYANFWFLNAIDISGEWFVICVERDGCLDVPLCRSSFELGADSSVICNGEKEGY